MLDAQNTKCWPRCRDVRCVLILHYFYSISVVGYRTLSPTKRHYFLPLILSYMNFISPKWGAFKTVRSRNCMRHDKDVFSQKFTELLLNEVPIEGWNMRTKSFAIFGEQKNMFSFCVNTFNLQKCSFPRRYSFQQLCNSFWGNALQNMTTTFKVY
jgi:hypothetical protein